jgi:hypothetical protein
VSGDDSKPATIRDVKILLREVLQALADRPNMTLELALWHVIREQLDVTEPGGD